MECKGDYGFEMIAADEIQEIIHRERTMLIDLRSVEYYQNGHIENARNFPYEYIREWQREIPSGISLILYCEHGNLSLLAARKLRGRKGALYTVSGGYQAHLAKNDF